MIQAVRIQIVTCVVALSACTTIYYNFWESLGKEKRDLLISNVEKVKGDQGDVQKELQDTLEKVRHQYKFDGGSLEHTYDQLAKDYQTAVDKSETLSSRIDKVETIAEDLFAEWEDEAEDITNANYRRDSLAKRKATMDKFSRMLSAMRGVEKSLQPALIKLKDQVLYLKHNLNAMALAGFKTEFEQIKREISQLSSDVKRSSQAADEFLGTID